LPISVSNYLFDLERAIMKIPLKRILFYILLLALTWILTPSASQADTIQFYGTPYSTWSSGGPHEYAGTTSGGVEFTVQAWDASGLYDVANQKDLGYKGQSGDGEVARGIGVYGGYAGGEIGADNEELRLLLNPSQSSYLTSVTLNFLYREYVYSAGDESWYFEGLSYSLNGGAFTTVYQSDAGQTYPTPFTPGELTLNFTPGQQVQSISLRSSGEADHDFVLNSAAVGGAATPEPASMFLFGSGMLGLAAWRRKRSKKVKED
jgi:hypothetical protein